MGKRMRTNIMTPRGHHRALGSCEASGEKALAEGGGAGEDALFVCACASWTLGLYAKLLSLTCVSV